jgi:hypothetical protein
METSGRRKNYMKAAAASGGVDGAFSTEQLAYVTDFNGKYPKPRATVQFGTRVANSKGEQTPANGGVFDEDQ